MPCPTRVRLIARHALGHLPRATSRHIATHVAVRHVWNRPLVVNSATQSLRMKPSMENKKDPFRKSADKKPSPINNNVVWYSVGLGRADAAGRQPVRQPATKTKFRTAICSRLIKRTTPDRAGQELHRGPQGTAKGPAVRYRAHLRSSSAAMKVTGKDHRDKSARQAASPWSRFRPTSSRWTTAWPIAGRKGDPLRQLRRPQRLGSRILACWC